MTKQINRLIASAMQELGATVFTITSDMKAAREESQRLAMINGGRILTMFTS